MFNKDLFAVLLSKAKGKRSINQYAKKENVDAGYISRLLRSQIDNAPSATVIAKLAEVSLFRRTLKGIRISSL